MSAPMVRCSPCPSRPTPWSAPVFRATPVRSTRWATARWCAPWPLATPHVMSTLVARAVSKSGTSASLAARAPCPNWTVWWAPLLTRLFFTSYFFSAVAVVSFHLQQIDPLLDTTGRYPTDSFAASVAVLSWSSCFWLYLKIKVILKCEHPRIILQIQQV